MPTYDYKCNACNHRMEAFQSMKDKPLRKCPACGKSALERLIGIGAAVLFKGSGFYQTDYRSESYKKAAASESGSNGSTSSTNSESKPAATKVDTAASSSPTPAAAPASSSSGSSNGSGKGSKKPKS